LTLGCRKEQVISSQKQCAIHENNLQCALLKIPKKKL